MPTYSIRAPDGKTYTVTGPAGATEAQVRAEVLRQHPKAAQPAKKDTSALSGLLAGAVKPIDNLATWASQSPVGKAVDDFGASLGFPRTKAAVQQNDAWRRNNTRGGWQVAGNIIGTLPTLALRNPIVQGAVGGAVLTDDTSLKGTAKSAALGGLFGKAGQVAGNRVIAPALERLGRTKPVRAVSVAATNAVNKALGTKVKPLPLPKLTPAEKRLPAIPPEALRNVEDAARLNLPFSLADASPELRSLGGSVTRFSPQARNMAEEAYGPRAAQINQRAINAIDEHLAPITDIAARSRQIRDTARAWSQPYYDKALAKSAPDDELLKAELRTPAGREALNRARTIMANEGKNADEIEYLIRDIGESPVVPDAGRYAKAPIGNEFDQVGTTKLRTYGGASIPKRGPLDLVGWLRLNGGLRDSGGELGHMGLTNAPRTGMDFVGQEARFGPLVNNTDGMNFDDAALKAWEAGYFPGLTERPSINEFLYAMRGTQEGWKRHFLPDDLPQIDAFDAARAQKYAAQEARSIDGKVPVIDTATDAGMRDFAPTSAYDVQEFRTPTFETLDYVKRGLDSVLNDSRNPLTGKLNMEGDQIAQSTNSALQRFKARLDELNPDYAKARSVYQDEIAPRTALQTGFNVLPKNNVPARDFNRALESIAPENLPEAARGYVTARADEVSRMAGGNPYRAVYGSLDEQSKVASLFPEEGVTNFGRMADLEREMGKTYTETLGGSATQPRAVADAQFAGMGPDMISAGVDLAGGNGLATASNLVRRGFSSNLGDRFSLGFGAKAKADQLAPMLFNTNPKSALEMLLEFNRKQAEMAQRARAYQAGGNLLGLPAVAASIPRED